MAGNALALTTLLRASHVTLLNMVPSAVSELLRTAAIPSSVRIINLAGEPLRTELVQQIYETTSVRTVYDFYGPTECTTYSTWALRTAHGPETIGRPIANTQVYILDAHRQPVPIGVTGELYISGEGLARGYLNQPELTAEKFITHSFAGEPARRLYKTGDLARYLPDGNIEFLGRVDHQVKLRGFRIELGEIEAVLRQHPGVRETVAVLREDTPGDKRLVAYLVPTQLQLPTMSELRSFMQSQLPDYMLPATFVFLDTFPLTPNGKVDRRALPPPESTRPELGQAFTAPRTSEEEVIAGSWAYVLGLERVGIHDNFFELGGHSLKATQVVARVRTALRIELPLRTLFEAPTVAGLATTITQSQEQASVEAELARLVTEVENMSDEEAQQTLLQVQPETI
jgi:acyl carrier protein